MSYCYKCGKEVDKTSGFCPNCGANLSIAKTGKKKNNSALGGILALLALGGIIVGAFLLIGGLIAALMNPSIESSSGGRVWAIGYIVWSIFYPTGLINSCFLVGVISLGVGIGSMILSDKID